MHNYEDEQNQKRNCYYKHVFFIFKVTTQLNVLYFWSRF